MNYTITEGTRNKSEWYWAGNWAYTKEKSYGQKTILRCRFARHLIFKCPGCAFIQNNSLQQTVNHSCDPNPMNENLSNVKTRMKRKAETTTEKLREIYDNELGQNPELRGMLSFPAIESTLSKQRKKIFPPNPTSPQEAINVLNDQESHLYKMIYQGFVETVNEDGGKESAILLANPEHFKILAEAKFAFVDATFSIVPTMGFYQLLFFQVEWRGVSLPVIGALMTSKSQPLYSAVFKKIKELIGLTCEFKPADLMSDFERGLQNALRETWPDSKVRGCRFHFGQAVIKKIRKLHLANEYRDNPDVRGWLKKSLGLCMLPAENIQEEWNRHCLLLVQFSGETKKNLLKFRKYIDSYWIAKVGPETFSVFGLDHKTNNNAEQLHSRLKKNFKSAHPGFWKFLSLFQKHVIEHTEDDIQCLLGNRQPKRKRKPDSHVEKIKDCESKVLAGVWSAERYLHYGSNFTTVSIGKDSDSEDSDETEDEAEMTDNNPVLNQRPICVVCLNPEKIVNAVMVPCGHIETCLDCAAQIYSSQRPHCPVCRAVINQCIRAFGQPMNLANS